jgi:hypothetical protein
MTNQKDYLLNESKSFCMLPWIHLHVTPLGSALPCCIGNQQETVGNVNDGSLMDLVNSEKMCDLRKDMMDDELNPACQACHRHEQQGITSFRQTNNEVFGKYFDEALSTTDKSTGKLANFKMRYFDIRLSNICNMKCRTCNSHYSSLWEQEDVKQGMTVIGIDRTARSSYVRDILPQINNMDMAYFAGGESLITEEHYVMLEEMIKQNKTDIVLRYNTNLSVLHYKDKDLIELWSHFKNKIQLYASLDHYGERAEYMRHGTNWGNIESNFNKLMDNNNVSMTVNSVVSIFNFVTFGDFYNYMLSKGWLTPKSSIFTVYNMISPVHLTALALPNEYKELGKVNIQNSITNLENNGIQQGQITQLSDAINWVNSDNTWEQQRDFFRSEVSRLDTLRGEDFRKVFPELQGLLDD